MKTNSEEYIRTEEGMADAKRFCKALTEGRIIATVERVSRSGMQRVIALREVRINEGDPFHKVSIWNFDYFAQMVGGFRMAKSQGNIIGGAGMNMIFHMIDVIAHEIKFCTDGELDCTKYTNNYQHI